jgi:glycosyltransferase involved in cell wall biosynthesis
MYRPFISIIIPTFNRPHFIVKAVKSVINQSFNDFEVIIVNDGSTDDTECILTPFLLDRRIKLLNIKRTGRGGVRNYGIDKANGKYITFLDDDDLYAPKHLESIHHIYSKEKRDTIIITDFKIKTNKSTNHIRQSTKSKSEFIKNVWYNGISLGTVSIPRAKISKSRFEPAYKYAQDFHFVFPILLKNRIVFTETQTLTIVNHSLRASFSINREDILYMTHSRLSIIDHLSTLYYKEMLRYIPSKDIKNKKMNDLLYLSNRAARGGHLQIAIKLISKIPLKTLITPNNAIKLTAILFHLLKRVLIWPSHFQREKKLK